MNNKVTLFFSAAVAFIWAASPITAHAETLLHDDFAPPYRPTGLASQEGWNAPVADENHALVLDASTNPEFDFPTKGRAVRVGANQTASLIQKSFGSPAKPKQAMTIRAVMAFNGDQDRSYLSLHRDGDETLGVLFGLDHQARRFCYQNGDGWKTFDDQTVFIGNGKVFYVFEAIIQPENGTWRLKISTVGNKTLVEAEGIPLPQGAWNPPPDTVSLRARNNRIFLDSITITQ